MLEHISRVTVFGLAASNFQKAITDATLVIRGLHLIQGRHTSEPVRESFSRLDARSIARRLTFIFLASYALQLLVAGYPQIRDPYFHFDDHAAVFALADIYYYKAVSEGRWLNYIWHLRSFLPPVPLNFQLYLAGWSLFAAATALNIFRNAPLQYPLLLAALIALGPQAVSISRWFNTLVPGVWILAGFAVAALFLSERAGRNLMMLFVPLTLQAYTSYPFLILGICLLREDRSGETVGLLRIVLLFGIALIFGVLAIYSVNYAVLGTFGLDPADWREPTPATSLEGITGNFPKVLDSVLQLYVETGFGYPVLSLFTLILFATSYWIVFNADKRDAIAIAIVFILGLGMLMSYALFKGIGLPFRATLFVWVVEAVTWVRAARILSECRRVPSIVPRLSMLALSLCVATAAGVAFADRSVWQQHIHEFISELPEGLQRVYIMSEIDDLKGSAALEDNIDFSYHFLYYSGIPTTFCALKSVYCPPIPSALDGLAPGDAPKISFVGGIAFVIPPRWGVDG